MAASWGRRAIPVPPSLQAAVLFVFFIVENSFADERIKRFWGIVSASNEAEMNIGVNGLFVCIANGDSFVAIFELEVPVVASQHFVFIDNAASMNSNK